MVGSMDREIVAEVGEVDWSELPIDLLILIFGKLEIPDLMKSGVVCKSWHTQCSSVRRLGLCSKNQGPCLISSSPSGEAALHSLSSNKVYCVHLPDVPPFHDTIKFGGPTSTPEIYNRSLPGGAPFRDRYIVGSSHGWLVAADERSELHLLNPITGAQIGGLPPLRTLSPVQLLFRKKQDVSSFFGHAILEISARGRKIFDGVEDQRWSSKHSVAETRRHVYLRAVLSGDPSSQGSRCTIVLIHRPGNHLSFARLGDTSWTWLAPSAACCGYHDCFFDDSDGLLYALRRKGEIDTIDLNGPAPVVESIFDSFQLSDDRVKYIVRSPWGDLLQVWRCFDCTDEGESVTNHVAVFKSDLATQELVQIKDLRGHALFLSSASSFFLSAKDFPVLTPNCVYLAHENSMYNYFDKHIMKEVMAYNKLDDTYIDLQPTLCSLMNITPPAVWLQPSWSLDR